MKQVPGVHRLCGKLQEHRMVRRGRVRGCRVQKGVCGWLTYDGDRCPSQQGKEGEEHDLVGVQEV